MVKYYVDQEIMLNYEKLQMVWSGFSPFCEYLFLFCQIKKSVLQYSDTTCLINKWIFGLSQFSKFSLSFEYW